MAQVQGGKWLWAGRREWNCSFCCRPDFHCLYSCPCMLPTSLGVCLCGSTSSYTSPEAHHSPGVVGTASEFQSGLQWNLSLSVTTVFPDNVCVVVFCFVLGVFFMFLFPFPLYIYLVLWNRCVGFYFFAWCYFFWSPESCIRPIIGAELWVHGIENEIFHKEMTLIIPRCSSRDSLDFFQIILKN